MILTGARREWFWAKVDTSAGPDGCWPWTASRNPKGYGQFNAGGGRMARAHRIAWADSNGPIPAGLQVDHKCHNRACVNPAHLQVVTASANQQNRAGSNRRSVSGHRNVHWDKYTGKWQVMVRSGGKNHHAGRFADLDDAKKAALDLRRRLFTNSLADTRGEVA